MSALSVASLRAGSAMRRQTSASGEARAAGDEERAPPAPARLDEAADEVAERAADGRRDVEDRERAALARPGGVTSSMIVGASVA